MTLVLRDYQANCMQAIERLSKQGTKRQLVVWATGLGKGTLLAELCRWWPGKVMAVAERDFLVRKMAEEFGAVTGENIAMDFGNEYSLPARITVSSVQSLSKKRNGVYRRLERYDAMEDNWLLLVDEAHHSAASSYRTICGYFQQNPQNMLIGVTATPDRHDKKSLIGEQRIFDALDYSKETAHNLSLPWGIDNGWLVPLTYMPIQVDEITEYVASHPNWKESELSDALEQDDEVAIKFASALTGHMEGLGDVVGARPTVVFCQRVTMAVKVAEAINAVRPGAADVISSWEEHSHRNDRVMEAFRRGQLQFLCNDNMVTEGVDVPNVGCVADCSPTKSRGRKTQRIGRGTRPMRGVVHSGMTAAERKAAIAASAKPYCLCLDFVGNSPSMVHSPDVLLPTATAFRDTLTSKDAKVAEAQVQEFVRREVADGRTPSQEELFAMEEEAMAMVEARDMLLTLSRHRKQMAVWAKTRGTHEVLPMDGIGGGSYRPPTGGNLATDKQIRRLERFGWSADAAKRLTTYEAQAAITTHVKAGDIEQPSGKMKARLKALGMWSDGLTFHEARERIGEAEAQGLQPDWSLLGGRYR